MKRCLILVEGQTEERFVKDLLAPAMRPLGLAMIPTVLKTKKVLSGPDFKGGVTSYAKMRSNLLPLLWNRGALVTTVIDYYGLPDDAPGMKTRPSGVTATERVRHVENAIFQDLGAPVHFVPFLALHEFEAWLFCDLAKTAAVIPAREKALELQSTVAGLEPEEINEGATTAPSKRLLRVFPSFRKALHGPAAAKRIGLEAIRSKCPHFDQWVKRLEHYAASQ
jgi:hypothetical protein